jgi:hypothetical protein
VNISDLLHDAVDEIEPADRIVELRARTANPARSAARPWFYAAGGVVLATAAAVTAFAVLGTDSSPGSHHHDPIATSTPAAETQVVPAYFVGDTPAGRRLYREFDSVPAGDPLQAALDRIQRPASDPDYTTSWTHGSFKTATLGDGTIDVEVGDAELPAADDVDVQQVVYTLQGAAQHSDWPVRFLLDGDEPLLTVDSLPQNDVLSPMSISDPAEGSSYSGSFMARGRANSFEANVRWELWDEDKEVVAHGFTTADGAGDRLYPWQAEVDLSGLPFGFYTFVALTDDPSAGEGPGPTTDTRLITVR